MFLSCSAYICDVYREIGSTLSVCIAWSTHLWWGGSAGVCLSCDMCDKCELPWEASNSSSSSSSDRSSKALVSRACNCSKDTHTPRDCLFFWCFPAYPQYQQRWRYSTRKENSPFLTKEAMWVFSILYHRPIPSLLDEEGGGGSCLSKVDLFRHHYVSTKFKGAQLLGGSRGMPLQGNFVKWPSKKALFLHSRPGFWGNRLQCPAKSSSRATWKGHLTPPPPWMQACIMAFWVMMLPCLPGLMYLCL